MSIDNTATTSPKPEVGMGATYSIGSDCYPVTIIKVTPCQITVRRDIVNATSGNYPNATYEFTPNPNGTVNVFRKNKRGEWRLRGEGCGYLSIGVRNYYRDPHFYPP